MAINSSSSQLLDLGQVGLEEVVDPKEEFSSGKVNCIVGIDSYFVYHLTVINIQLTLVLSELEFLLHLHLGTTRQGFFADWAGVLIFQPGEDAFVMVTVSAWQFYDLLVLLELALTNWATFFRFCVRFVLKFLNVFLGEPFGHLTNLFAQVYQLLDQERRTS